MRGHKVIVGGVAPKKVEVKSFPLLAAQNSQCESDSEITKIKCECECDLTNQDSEKEFFSSPTNLLAANCVIDGCQTQPICVNHLKSSLASFAVNYVQSENAMANASSTFSLEL